MAVEVLIARVQYNAGHMLLISPRCPLRRSLLSGQLFAPLRVHPLLPQIKRV